MFKKKFKVRVSHFSGDKYTVEYCHYRFIPIWHPLLFWFEQTLTGGTECWSMKLFYVKDAEQLASQIKSIEDVKNWYKKDEEREREFYREKQEYYKKNVPYKRNEI